jgi:hypothetical protein
MAPRFIKCDAEGAEAMILRGGERMLSEVRPLMQIELNVANSPECRQIFDRFGYRLHDAITGKEIGAETPWEVLAIPE